MKLCILLLTYNRLEYALITLNSVLSNLKFDGELYLHIADDGSSQEYRDRLAREIELYMPSLTGISYSNSERGGYGRNYNLAIQTVHSIADVVLPLEDDWQMMRPFDVTALCSLVTTSNKIQCVRLGYLGHTEALYGEMVYEMGQHFFLINKDTPERHVFAGHPRIESVEWEKKVGPWKEGFNQGETELCTCNQAREGVAWPVDLVRTCGDLFAHIGSVKA